MTFLRLTTLGAAAALAAGVLIHAARAADQPTDDMLVQALQQGGLVIAFGQGEVRGAAGDGCPAASLSRRDRADAEQVGEAFRRLQIPVGLVVTNRLCPTREAASVAFGLAVATADLEEPQATERMRAHIASPVPSGENRVLVTQADILRAVTGLAAEELQAGDALVFAPQEDGGFRIISRVSPERWHALAGSGRPQRRADIG